MIDVLLDFLKDMSAAMPVPLFVFLGSLMEELVALLPSPFVTTLAGSLAASQNSGLAYVVLLALVATIAKTIGCYGYYILADKGEDLISSRYGKLLGLSHDSIQAVGKRFEKGGRDELVVFALRALPIMPSAPVSVLAGIIKLNIRHYLIASGLGMFVRSFFFVYLGFIAAGTLEELQARLDGYGAYGNVMILMILAVFIVYIAKTRLKPRKNIK